MTTDSPPSPAAHRAGFVALAGRPNVGKSTLLNRLLGQKLAAVTAKPQTTRGRILGILHRPEAQVAFIDTPGLHRARSLLNERMVRVAEEAISEADVTLWILDATQPVGRVEEEMAANLASKRGKLLVALNKIDRLARIQLLPLLSRLAELLPEVDVVPISARRGSNLDRLLELVVAALPEGPPLFDADTFTDQTERTLAQELIREKILLLTEQEVPYSVAVTVDQFEEKEGLAVIHATIHVERASQKGILIGAGGRTIREIGRAARTELEPLLERRVFLELFVRVQEEWTRQERHLRDFGL